MELLADIIFNSQFSETQLERERIVILDEINSYLDTPSALIYDDFEQVVFNSHDLGKPILGTPQSLMNITSEAMKAYVERQFKPEKMVFFSVGKTPFSKVMKKAEKHFNVHNTTTTPEPKARIAPLETTVVESIAMDKDTHQTHYIIGKKTYNMFHPDRATLYLLNSILGGLGMNSRLNNSLREKNGLVYTVESTHSLYSDSGLFSIYFGCDPKNTKKCVNLIHKEFQKLKQTPLTPHQLSKAKKQLKGELGIAFENKENMALDMAKSFLHFDRYINLEEVSEQIEHVTALQIQSLANELLSIDEFSSLHYS
jgi:predicted Zn-dependent peptidase